MKRIVTLLLCLAMLLSMVACNVEKKETATADSTPTTTKVQQAPAPVETEEETEEPARPTYNEKVEDTSMIEQLNAIPIANSSMSSDQLREICLTYMRLACSFTYTPSKDYTYTVASQEYDEIEYKGKVYAGLPYVTVGSGSLYRVAHYYDPETGVLNVTPFANSVYYGNACSGGVCTSWSRCVNSVQFGYTMHMTQKNGYIPVGPYTYPNDFTLFGENDRNNYDVTNVCKENGEQKMYQSYAAMGIADGLVNTGHVRMNSMKPHVVYNEDGTIDGNKSYTTYCDQICYNTSDTYKRTQSDGTVYYTQGGVDVKVSFYELFKTHYIPFTFEEFLDPSKVEKAYVDISVEGDSITYSQLRAATIKSNYNISDITFTLKDETGKVVMPERYLRSKTFFVYEIPLAGNIENVFPSTMVYNYANGKGYLEVKAQLYNGELLTVYSGTVTYDG